MPSYAPRFGPLGIDNDGRVYWALTPSLQDRTHALQFLSLKASGALQSKRAKGKKKEAKTSDYREWSRFLAVWGKRPVGENMSGDEADGDQWWIFEEPADIQKLSDWASIVQGSSSAEEVHSPSSTSSKSPQSERIDALVKNLKDFAGALEWRVKGSDE